MATRTLHNGSNVQTWHYDTKIVKAHIFYVLLLIHILLKLKYSYFLLRNTCLKAILYHPPYDREKPDNSLFGTSITAQLLTFNNIVLGTLPIYIFVLVNVHCHKWCHCIWLQRTITFSGFHTPTNQYLTQFTSSIKVTFSTVFKSVNHTIYRIYTVSQKTVVPNFCDNFVKS